MRRFSLSAQKRFLSKRRRSSSSVRRAARLRIEKLEERVPLAADLAVTDAYLVDLDANPISNVVEGERALVRVDYTTTDLTSAMQYVIHFEMDGVATESQVITGMPGTNLQYFRFRYAGYASPGTRQVRVTLDATNQIAETNESNNTFAFDSTPIKPDVPEKFILPVTGVPSDDWTILNHHDVDLRIGFREDFAGGFLQYDGHAGWDIFVANFDQMDEGVPVRAAAGGVVIESGDGSFDREDFWDFTLPDPRIANYVIIDHGDGWQTAYYHLQRDTVTVEVGEQIVAGQTLGLIASSGITDGPHVHFAIERNGVPVEPMYALGDYFVDPPEYLGHRAPKVTASGITDRHPSDDFKELPNDIRNFALNGGVNPWLWYRLEYVNSGDVISTEWRRPNGSLYSRFDWTAPDDIRYLRFWAWDTAIRTPGRWTVISYLDDVELTRESYSVISAGGAPEIDLRQEDVYIIDGRSTPIAFGSQPQGTLAPIRVFTINNIGTATLSVSDLRLPKGFELVGAFPGTVASGGSQDFRVRMRTSDIDHHWGDIRFSTNDADESLFSFGIEGTVTGNRHPGAPVITAATTALAIEAGLAVERVFPALTIADSDSTTLGGAKLIANITSGRDDAGTDRLILQPASPEVRVHQDSVLYQGLPVATILNDGSLGQLELLFSGDVSRHVVEQVARSITFWQQQLDTTSRRRTVDLQLVDPAGLPSNTSRRAVFYADAVFNHPPRIESLIDQVMDEDTQLGPIPLSIEDLNHPLQGLRVEASSSNPTLVPMANINTHYASGQWSFDLTPADDEFGSAVITLLATDGDGVRAHSSFDLTVQSINDLPAVSAIADQSVEKGAATSPVTFQIDDVETSAADLLLVGSSSNPTLIDTGGITFGGDATNRTITLSPKTDQMGQATITVVVHDEHGGARSTEFEFTVTPELQKPTITSIADQQTLEDEPVTIAFTVEDNETPSEEIELTGTSNNDLFLPASFEFAGVGAERTLQLTPTADQSGQAEIVVSAVDNVGNVALTTFVVTVAAVNDTPTFELQEQVSASEDAPAQVLSVNNVTAGGGEEQPVRFNVIASEPGMFETLDANYDSGQSMAEIVWKSAPNVFGETTIMVTATDGGLDGELDTVSDNGQTTRTVSVNISAVNDAPELLSLPTGTFPEDATSGVVGAVTVTDRDPEDSHTVTTNDARFAVVNGELRLKDGAQFDFETEPTIAVEVTATDAADESITAQTTITITDTNEAPTVLTIEDFILYEEILGQPIGELAVTDQDTNQSHVIESLDDRFEVVDGVLQLKADKSIDPGTATIGVQLRVTDSGQPPITEDFELQLQTTSVDSPWRNQVNKFDVNVDSVISPIDVLLVINYLNGGGNTALAAITNPPRTTGPYYDVSGDRFVSPLDPLLVINWLNRPGGEGEYGTPYAGLSYEYSRRQRSLVVNTFNLKVDDDSQREAMSTISTELAFDLNDQRPTDNLSSVRPAAVSSLARRAASRTGPANDWSPSELSSIDEVFAQMLQPFD